MQTDVEAKETVGGWIQSVERKDEKEGKREKLHTAERRKENVMLAGWSYPKEKGQYFLRGALQPPPRCCCVKCARRLEVEAKLLGEEKWDEEGQRRRRRCENSVR